MLDYDRPKTLSEALRVLARDRRTVLAGGTDLYPGTQAQTLRRPVLDISAVEGLRGIRAEQGGLCIGACTTWTDIIAADLPPAFDALKLAAAEVGARQIQNAATVAGNICNASPAADGVPALLVLDAEVDLESETGNRRVPLSDFIKGVRQTDRRADEIVTSIRIPQGSLTGTSSFLKLGARKYLVISIAMIAVRLAVAGGRVAAAAISVGSCSAIAVRLGPVEARLVGQKAEPGLSSRIMDRDVAACLSPIDDVRGTADYRMMAAGELVRRAVEKALP